MNDQPRTLETLVLLRECIDPQPVTRARPGGTSGDPGIRRMANPADLEALDLALELAGPAGRVTVLCFGVEESEAILREALSRGASRAIRLSVPGLDLGDPAATAQVLRRVLAVLTPRLFLTGSRLLDRGDDPAAALAAAGLGWAWVPGVIRVALDGEAAEALRRASGGARERVRFSLPAALGVAPGSRILPYPPLDAVLAALDAAIEEWEAADLGLASPTGLPSGPGLRPGGHVFPRPRTRRLPAPAASLPAFERIRVLLSGGIAAREGALVTGSPEEVAEGLFRLLEEQGLLRLPSEAPGGGSAPAGRRPAAAGGES